MVLWDREYFKRTVGDDEGIFEEEDITRGGNGPYLFTIVASSYVSFLNCVLDVRLVFWCNSASLKPIMKLSITILPFLVTLAQAADKNAWKSRSIYFALTDRIARNTNDNGGGSCGNLGDYCGGTFQGLQGKLDYIKRMGFDAIWITPVVASK